MLGVAGVGFQRLRSRSAASPMLSIVREIARGALLGQVGGLVGVGDIFFFFLFWGWVGEEKRWLWGWGCIFLLLSCPVVRSRFFLKAAVLLGCCCVIMSVEYLSPFVREDIFFFRLSQSLPHHHHHHHHDNAMELAMCSSSVTEIFEARQCR